MCSVEQSIAGIDVPLRQIGNLKGEVPWKIGVESDQVYEPCSLQKHITFQLQL